MADRKETRTIKAVLKEIIPIKEGKSNFGNWFVSAMKAAPADVNGKVMEGADEEHRSIFFKTRDDAVLSISEVKVGDVIELHEEQTVKGDKSYWNFFKVTCVSGAPVVEKSNINEPTSAFGTSDLQPNPQPDEVSQPPEVQKASQIPDTQSIMHECMMAAYELKTTLEQIDSTVKLEEYFITKVGISFWMQRKGR